MAISSILAPVDFSEDSARGAALARDIARRHGARLTLLHVDGVPTYSEGIARSPSPTVLTEYLEQRHEVLQKDLHDFAVRLGCAHDTDRVLARGHAAKGIQEHARTKACDLIVISPKGSGYGHQFLLGSVSAEVAARAVCPVLVARTRSGTATETGAFSSPLVAVSDIGLAERALAFTMDLAEPTTRIHLLHVLEPAEIRVGPPLPGAFHAAVSNRRKEVQAELERLAAPIKQEGFAAITRVETGDPSFSLLCRVESDQCALVVVARKAHPDCEGALATPAYRMVKHSPVPVLVVPGPPK